MFVYQRVVFFFEKEKSAIFEIALRQEVWTSLRKAPDVWSFLQEKGCFKGKRNLEMNNLLVFFGASCKTFEDNTSTMCFFD